MLLCHPDGGGSLNEGALSLCHPEPCVLFCVIPRRKERLTRDPLASERARGDSSRSPLSLALPVQGRVPSGARREGCKGWCHAGRTIPQSLRDSSLYRVPTKIFKFLWDVAREPSLTSSRTGRSGKKSRFLRTNGVYFLTKCRA